MAYKFEEELRSKAEEFIKKAKQSGFREEFKIAQVRDYQLKIEAEASGYINIYYSPKKQAFSLKTHEMRDRQLASRVEGCWDMLEGSRLEAYSETYQAFVDGSFLDGRVGYGAVIVHDGQEVKRLSGEVEQHTAQRQIAGELTAVLQVFAWCSEQKIEAIDIVYDYEGIEKWALGEWAANNEVTQTYARTVKASPITVIWHKVKSHTGIRWNDIADELAKQGARRSQDSVDAQEEDRLVALERSAKDFLSFLQKHGILAEFRGIYNGQFARFVFERGIFDLYNTAKHPMSPRLHNFSSDKLKTTVESLWTSFSSGSAAETAPPDTRFDEVKHYLQIFEPYRHAQFDFKALALALAKISAGKFDPMAHRADFSKLEQIYKQLRGQS